MTAVDGSRPSVNRQRVLDAVILELAGTNAGSLTMKAVAKRAGVDVEEIREVWANTPALLTEALFRYAREHIRIPDTGTLRGDMLGYAKAYAASLNSPVGRRLIDAVVATPKDWDVTGWRSAFFAARGKTISKMMRRAVDRGELSPDVDAVRVIDLVAGGLFMSLQFYDRPVTDEDCEFVVDTVLNGIRPNR